MPPPVSRVQSISLTRPLLGLLGILVSILGTFLQLRFQSAGTSPFDTHRLHILAFFTVIVICAISLGVEIKLQAAGSDCRAIVSTIFLLAGSLALILLLLIIEPYVGWPVLILWFFYLVKLACESYREIRNSIVSAVESADDFLKNLFNRNRNQNGEANLCTNVKGKRVLIAFMQVKLEGMLRFYQLPNSKVTERETSKGMMKSRMN
ncbi:hypothetical protein SLEP1_g56994 [Rubroshorea leprosula]|uniref:Uncharacterized protein n=1 Tax=Rubroshorea leprosula TaxID=152421 RepID=A0AAV5MK22_9ROSI|nr:hypothetical protein SLEP1_g56994 [Rubroshorea leprosula]